MLADLERVELDSAEFNPKLVELRGAVLDSAEFNPKLVELRGAVLAHAEREERDECTRIRQSDSAAGLAAMVLVIPAAEAVAPTHPHPRVPSTALGNLAAGPFLSILDRARDVMREALERLQDR
jgi:hypothetical protein